MSPIKEVEIEEIDSIHKLGSDFWDTKAVNKEKRLYLYHIVTHMLACLIITSYLIMIIFQVEIPKEYSTIVSVVVGFYFARVLFN